MESDWLSVLSDVNMPRKGGIAMLIIDPQKDFHPPTGSLAVAGALEDSERITAFIQKHQDKISQINITLDSHQSYHIAHAVFWEDAEGHPPAPFTLITANDVKNGKWRPTRSELTEYVLKYTQQLEVNGRFILCIWPEHCIIGSVGNSIVDNIHEQALLWARASKTRVNYVCKGSNCFTEHYSALRADVEIPSDSTTRLNLELVRTLKRADVVVVCGEALSHCVNFTTRDLITCWGDEPLNKICLLSDCASSVPGFEESGVTFIKDMKQLGVTVCTSEEFKSYL